MKSNDENDDTTGFKWGWYTFLILLFLTILALIGKLFGIATGYRWWWWLITVLLPFVVGGIVALFQQEAKNSVLRPERIISQADFKKLRQEKKQEIRSGNITVGIGCQKGFRTKTEFQPGNRIEHQVSRYLVAPLSFDVSPRARETEYMTSMKCPTCGRELSFCVKRHDQKPKVLLEKKGYVYYNHHIFGWPMLLDKVQKHVSVIRAFSLVLCLFGLSLPFLSIALPEMPIFFFILVSVMAIAVGIFLAIYSFPLALKHYEYAEKGADDLWESAGQKW